MGRPRYATGPPGTIEPIPQTNEEALSKMSDATPVAIRRALTRKGLAAARHRAAVGRLLGLSETELLALQHLGMSGRLTPSALGSLLRLTSGGTTALVQRLERTGRVAREAHPADRRSTLLRLTPQAEEEAIG